MELSNHIRSCSYYSYIAVLLADVVVSWPYDGDKTTRLTLWSDMSSATKLGIVWC